MDRTDQVAGTGAEHGWYFPARTVERGHNPRHGRPHACRYRVSEAGRQVRRRGGSPRRMSSPLQDLLGALAFARPEVLSLLSEGAPLSYGELDAGSNRL